MKERILWIGATIVCALISTWCWIDFHNGKEVAFNLITGIINSCFTCYCFYRAIEWKGYHD